MAIYELEERVYFDGAAAVDLGEVTDTELHDSATDLDLLSEAFHGNDSSEHNEIESAEYLDSIAASNMLDYANIFNDSTFSSDPELNAVFENFINSPSEQLTVADSDVRDFNTTTFAHRTLVSGIADPEITLAEFNSDSVAITNIESTELANIEYNATIDTDPLMVNTFINQSSELSLELNENIDNCDVSISDYHEAKNSTSAELSVDKDISVIVNNDLVISLDPDSDKGTESTSIGPEATDTSPPESMNNEQLISNNDNTVSFTVTPSDSQLATDHSPLATRHY